MFSLASCSDDSPWNPSGLQHVGDAHIPRPDVKLPLLQAEHATQDGARVDSDPHIHVKIQLLLHVPEWWTKDLPSYTKFKDASDAFYCR